MIALTRKIFKDHWLGLTLMASGLALYSWFIVSFYPSFAKIDIKKIIDQYPPALKAFFALQDTNLATFEGFANVEYFSLMWVIIVAGYIIAFATAEISKEIENGTIESLLSLPISRFKILLTKWLNMILVIILLVIVTTGSVIVFADLFDVLVRTKSMVMISILGFLFFAAIGTFTMALAVFFNERNKAVFIPIVFLIFGYVWNSVGQLVEKIEDYRFLSIFYYFDSAQALGKRSIDLNSLLVFGTIIIVSTVFTFWWFRRRDFAI